MEKKMSYEEAVARLKELVAVLESPDAPISGVEKELKEAMELLAFCKKELDGYEESFGKIMEPEEK